MSNHRCELDYKYTVKIGEDRWATIVVDEGPELPLSPETVRRLHVFLNQGADHRCMAISEACIATVEDGWFSLLFYHRDDYAFSKQAFAALQNFLNSALGPVERGGEEEDAS